MASSEMSSVITALLSNLVHFSVSRLSYADGRVSWAQEHMYIPEESAAAGTKQKQHLFQDGAK